MIPKLIHDDDNAKLEAALTKEDVFQTIKHMMEIAQMVLTTLQEELPWSFIATSVILIPKVQAPQ